MWPMAYAMVSTVSPKANATPRKPMPVLGNVALSTAAPHPPKTSQAVPRSSAASRRVRARDIRPSVYATNRVEGGEATAHNILNALSVPRVLLRSRAQRELARAHHHLTAQDFHVGGGHRATLAHGPGANAGIAHARAQKVVLAVHEPRGVVERERALRRQARRAEEDPTLDLPRAILEVRARW